MTKRLLLGLLLAGAALFAACGGDVISLGAVGGGASADAGDAGMVVADAGSATADAADDAGGSDLACIATSPGASCPAGEYCRADVMGTCGAGHCRTIPPPPPPSCPFVECGCDGKIRCAGGAVSSGVDVGSTQCTITCGPTTCDAMTSYCEHAAGGTALPDGGGGTESWTCKPLPTACATNRSCACVIQNTGGGVCDSDADQKVRIFEPLP